MNFSELGLSPEILKAVEDMGFAEATDIQSQAIPVMLSGRDLIGKSHTGTGKTAAFGLPAVNSIDRDRKGVQVLVMCPTRELAMQACAEINKFSAYCPWVKACAIYGGANIERQITDLKRGVNIVVGTPGRIMDHLRRHTLHLEQLKTVILDEADEMLDMGFREDIEDILVSVPEERQTVLFSATMPPEIMAITDRFQNDPVLIKAASKSMTVESVEQYYYDVPMGRKTDALVLLLRSLEPKLSMVFCNTKKMVDELTDSLVSKGFRAAGLHGDMKQQSRTQTLNAFKSGRINILIATDVAARGIDIDGIDAVFNYDIPQDNEYYIHRIGRTGRAGKTGCAYTLAGGRRQIHELKELARFVKADISERELPTRDDIVKARSEKLAEKLSAGIETGRYEAYKEQLASLIGETGLSAEDIAAALLGMKMGDEMRNIPDLVRSRPVRNAAGGEVKTVKVEISAGRSAGIAPNFIIGALADATGMSGKSFGKIDIYDKFTTVEVPEEDKEHVIKSMSGGKINGQRVTVKLYEGRKNDRSGRPYKQDSRRRNDPRRNDGRNDNRRNDRHKSFRRKG